MCTHRTTAIERDPLRPHLADSGRRQRQLMTRAKHLPFAPPLSGLVHSHLLDLLTAAA